MERRWRPSVFVSLALAGALLGFLPGCLNEASHRPFLRQGARTKASVDDLSSSYAETPAASEERIGADGETILRRNQRSGAWSSEAAEIESHLGASR